MLKEKKSAPKEEKAPSFSSFVPFCLPKLTVLLCSGDCARSRNGDGKSKSSASLGVHCINRLVWHFVSIEILLCVVSLCGVLPRWMFILGSLRRHESANESSDD